MEIEKKLPKVSRGLNSTCQTCSMCKKMVKDVGRELERTIYSYQKEILLYEKKVQESWMPALLI